MLCYFFYLFFFLIFFWIIQSNTASRRPEFASGPLISPLSRLLHNLPVHPSRPEHCVSLGMSPFLGGDPPPTPPPPCLHENINAALNLRCVQIRRFNWLLEVLCNGPRPALITSRYHKMATHAALPAPTDSFN